MKEENVQRLYTHLGRKKYQEVKKFIDAALIDAEEAGYLSGLKDAQEIYSRGAKIEFTSDK
jgi:hypothetical protein